MEKRGAGKELRTRGQAAELLASASPNASCVTLGNASDISGLR